MAKWGLDAGHGFTDSGAVNAVAKEKDLNLIVTLELGRLLTLAGEQVVYTRTNDIAMSIPTRCKILNDAKVDYAISVHHNAGGGDGGEAIHSITLGKGEALAEAIVEQFRAIGQNVRKVFSRANSQNKDYYGMIRLTDMPCVITEFGFMDNAKDFAQFDEKQELMAEAKAIAEACLNFVGKKLPTDVSSLVDRLAYGEAIVDKVYWTKVFRGEIPANPEYLMVVFERLLK